MFVSARPIRKSLRWRLPCLLLSAVGLLPLGAARAQEPDYEAVGERLIEAVKARELTPEQAVAMMGELARVRFAARLRKACHDRDDRDERGIERRSRENGERGARDRKPDPWARYRATEKRLRAAVEGGRVSVEDARARLEAMRREMGERGARDRGPDPDAGYRAVVEHLRAAVKAGKISAGEAERRLAEIRKREAYLRKVRARLEAMVESGELTEAEAKIKMEAIKRRAASRSF